MATRGKTRGPKESKYIKKAKNDSPKFDTRKKKQEKQVGAAKK